MKAKILFITLFLLLQGKSVFTQCISIELSITWKLGYDIFNKDSVINIPMLNIIYRNNCDTNYYFFKISAKDGKHMVMCPALRSFTNNSTPLSRAMAHDNYANENFDVKIGRSPRNNIGWWIEGGNADYVRKYGIDHDIRCCLHDIYEYFNFGRYDTSERLKHGYFQPSLFTPENILSGSVQYQFVFLKPGETHIDTYNLIGYKIVEGCFTFLISQDTIMSYVLGSDSIEIELPEIVGEYQLFSGAFNTNKITVCFGNK